MRRVACPVTAQAYRRAQVRARVSKSHKPAGSRPGCAGSGPGCALRSGARAPAPLRRAGRGVAPLDQVAVPAQLCVRAYQQQELAQLLRREAGEQPGGHHARVWVKAGRPAWRCRTMSWCRGRQDLNVLLLSAHGQEAHERERVVAVLTCARWRRRSMRGQCQVHRRYIAGRWRSVGWPAAAAGLARQVTRCAVLVVVSSRRWRASGPPKDSNGTRRRRSELRGAGDGGEHGVIVGSVLPCGFRLRPGMYVRG